MKYIRKIAVLIIAAVLLASVAIGFGVIYAVKNVNVTLYSYTCEADGGEAIQKIGEFKDKILSEVRGKIISSVSKEKVASAISEKNYYYVSDFEKVYPCTLNVTIKERKEVFYTAYDADGANAFCVFDDNGNGIRIAENEEKACNPDGVPNLFVESADETDLTAYSDKIANICLLFESKFGILGSVAEKAVVTFGIEEIFTLNLKCGLKIVVYDYSKLTEEKVGEAYKYIKTLSGGQKLTAEVHCFVNADNQVFVTHR